MSSVASILGATVLQDLLDRSVDTRMRGAYQVELMAARKSSEDGRALSEWTVSLIGACRNDLLVSPNTLFRRTALIILTNVCVGTRLKLGVEEFNSILTHCLHCVSDEDAKVRYTACESLYNMIKSNSARVVVHSQQLLNALCKVAGDSDLENRQTAAVFGRLLKEVVHEHMSSDSSALRLLWATVETHSLFPSPIVKQLSLDWMSFLRDETSWSVYLSRISHIFPPLVSLISSMEGVTGSRRDLATQAKLFLEKSLSVVHELDKDSMSRLIGVLIKYGTFQSTMSDTTKIILFDFIGACGPAVSDPEQAASLITVCLKTLLSVNLMGGVREAVLDAHETMIRSEHIRRLLTETKPAILMECLVKIIPRCSGEADMVCEYALEWMGLFSGSHSQSIEVVQVLLLVIRNANRNSLRKRAAELLGQLFDVEKFGAGFARMFNELRVDDPLAASEAATAVIESLEVSFKVDFVKSVTDELLKLGDACESIFSFVHAVVVAEGSNELRDKETFVQITCNWKSTCAGGYIVVSILMGQFGEVYDTVQMLDTDDIPLTQLEGIASAIESVSMLHVRLHLVREKGSELLHALREIAMRMKSETLGYDTFIKRIQLAA
jgi:hypothetical protein